MRMIDHRIERMLRHESYLKIQRNRVRKKMDAFFLIDAESYTLLHRYLIVLKKEIERSKALRKKIEYVNLLFARFGL